MERESMEFDVVIVGAGPSGLAAAIKLKQGAIEKDTELNVCIVEKGSEVGAHILSGAIFETSSLTELFPNWKELGAPLNTKVEEDEIYVLSSDTEQKRVPHLFVPSTMTNEGNYIISLGNLCRWLAEKAEELGVEIFPGFAAAQVLYASDGSVKGIITGDMGVAEDGSHKESYMPGMELHAKTTIFAEGARGHLGKELIAKYQLDENKETPHYGLGIKELWEIPSDQHKQGLVVHSAGWPLKEHQASGGAFMYHLENNQVVIGLITDLSYSNPYLSPFEEFQRMKKHPLYANYLKNGKRISYGARALNKGGLQSLPKLHFPGGMMIGCDAGTMNGAKIKGSHTAMKSGIVAAQTLLDKLAEGLEYGADHAEISKKFDESSLYTELQLQRNFGPAQHKWGNILGSAYAFIDINIFRGILPWTLTDPKPDYSTLKPANQCSPINYPKPDGVLTFDRLSSVFLSNTNHEENQIIHLQLKDDSIPLNENLKTYAEPAQRYCPAGVYEIIESDQGPRFQINSQNCIHCKTCDIKDPAQNITWVTPEGSGGPNYPNM